jgi:hypothetical protein
MEYGIRKNLDFKFLVLAAAFIAVIGISKAFSQESNVYRIQSLFLYNFTKHVKWEGAEGSTFTIGIYGNSLAYNEIRDNLGEKMVWGKKVNIIQINSPEEVSKCHIAYMPKSNKKKVVDLINASNSTNTLIVTEDDLVSDGAAISFVFLDQKMNFKISKDKIEQSGMKVSSSLLSIGIPV